MKLIKIFNSKKQKAVLVIQCRLSSTRLPGKALLPLGGKTVLEWVLASMKNVPAQKYYLAVDEASADALRPYAEKCGYELYAGDRDDVLKRFCDVIQISKADVVIRATADNPFLFYEAASSLLEEYNKRLGDSPVDYITYSGLPHGSGIEIFNAHSLLDAATKTSDPYDHEHVGPALYNHKENYKCEFIKAPKRYFFPELRTTIDTAADYRRALGVVHHVSGDSPVTVPYTTETILAAFNSDAVRNTTLFIPCIKKGRGTGHLRRCLDLAVKCNGDIYIPEDCELDQAWPLVEEAFHNGLQQYQIIKSLSNLEGYNLAVTDLFCADEALLKQLSTKCAVASIDEGSDSTDCVDYLLDIIPSSLPPRKPNLNEPGFIPLPENKHEQEVIPNSIKTVLVAFGGEDPAGLTAPCARLALDCGFEVTAISTSQDSVKTEGINYIPPVKDLKNQLYKYDLVITHYGFTAFEASHAGCAVMLIGTSLLHVELSKKHGFAFIPKELLNSITFKKALKDPKIMHKNTFDEKNLQLHEFVQDLSHGHRISCPVCNSRPAQKDTLVARTPHRTFRRCNECGMLYMSWTMDSSQTEYNRAYFYEDYQKQYGKTYIEDFASIKAQGVRRVSVIDLICSRHHSKGTPSILDIGCAMGPFLDAANDSGWQVYGTDVSSDAVDYVQNTLHYPAVCSSFPEFDSVGEFGIEQYDAVTMWYVIEHFQNLDNVLKAISALVKKGGVFAFSTPSAAGVSAKYNTQSFFENSPADHYTLWEPSRAGQILKRYGFKVEKIVSTGIHPERHPTVKKHGWQESSIQFIAAKTADKLLKLGDTFEVYCKKI